jgi:hypothetical protein
MKYIIYFFALVAFMLAFSACGKDGISDEELEGFAARIEQAIRDENVAFLNQVADKKSILHRLVLKMQVPQQEQQQAAIGLSMGFDLGSLLVQRSRGCFYDCTRIYNPEEGVPVLVFRTLGENGIQYDGYYITKKDGKLFYSDMFMYASGQSLVEFMQQIIFPEMGLDPESGEPNATLSALHRRGREKLAEINVLLVQKQPEKALDVLQSLDPVLQADRLYELAALRIFRNMDFVDFANALKDFIIKYSDSPQLVNFYSIEAYLAEGDGERARSYIERLQKQIGDDPALDQFMGLSFLVEDDLKRAHQYFDQMTQQFPDFFESHLCKLLIAIAQGDEQEENNLRQHIAGQFAFSQKDIDQELAFYPWVYEYRFMLEEEKAVDNPVEI